MHFLETEEHEIGCAFFLFFAEVQKADRSDAVAMDRRVDGVITNAENSITVDDVFDHGFVFIFKDMERK
jgi:hypothetical protein